MTNKDSLAESKLLWNILETRLKCRNTNALTCSLSHLLSSKTQTHQLWEPNHFEPDPAKVMQSLTQWADEKVFFLFFCFSPKTKTIAWHKWFQDFMLEVSDVWSSCSLLKVFLTRSAVRRAAGLPLQHSHMTLTMTFMICNTHHTVC